MKKESTVMIPLRKSSSFNRESPPTLYEQIQNLQVYDQTKQDNDAHYPKPIRSSGSQEDYEQSYSTQRLIRNELDQQPPSSTYRTSHAYTSNANFNQGVSGNNQEEEHTPPQDNENENNLNV